MKDKEVLKEPPEGSEELFDIFDENMNHIGIAPRSEAHKKGLWHMVFQCWFFRRKEEETYVLLQKRCPFKDTYPDLFDTSSAGHIKAGEPIEEGVRELYEELGVTADYRDLISLGILKQQKEEKEYKDYQFAYLYLYESNKPLEDYTLQREEITALVEVPLKVFNSLIEGELNAAIAQGVKLNSQGEKERVKYSITFNDLVPHGKAYYKKVVQGIENYISQVNI